ncbi:MAG: class I SAM-dependent methyltransferase [Gammaproteobacteria bacterium]|nr:class I SAM-dependent methyltransferase [Gammaproteobacteria bacterium]
MIKRFVYDLLTGPTKEHALKHLAWLERFLPSARSRFAVPFVFQGRGHFKTIRPRQNPVEIERLFEIICDLQPERVLEVGTARGGTLYLWAQAASDNATLVSVDLPGGDFGGAYADCRGGLYQAFARQGQNLQLLLADSHRPETRQKVVDHFYGEQIDFAFIDGDHTYEGVKADFLDYGKLVRPGGIIAFHDILYRRDQPTIRVDKLWKELSEQYPCEAVIGPDGSGKKIGIGVLRVPEGGV